MFCFKQKKIATTAIFLYSDVKNYIFGNNVSFVYNSLFALIFAN